MPKDINLHACYLQATSSSQKFTILPIHHAQCMLHVQLSVQTEVNDLLTLARTVVKANCKPSNGLAKHLKGELPSSEVKTLAKPFAILKLEVHSSLFRFLFCTCFTDSETLQHCCIQHNCQLGKTPIFKVQSIWDTLSELKIA